MAKIDVIIPTYNRAKKLDRAIASVVAQTWRDWNLLVVDDGSTDETWEIVQEWQKKDPRVSYTAIESSGVSRARNVGIQQGKAPWVALLDSDDEWLPEKLSSQWEYSQKHPEHLLIHCEEIWIRNGARVNPMSKHQKQGGRIFAQCLPLCCISPSAVMIRRSLFSEVGYFREDFPVCEDYDLWLKICSKYEVGFIPEPMLKKYGGHDDQLSKRFHSMDYYRILAMGGQRESQFIDEQERKLLVEIMQAKVKILLNGYRKHQNLADYDEVFALSLD